VPVASPVAFYDGLGIGTQNITVVDALTAVVAVSPSGPLVTADVGQLLAAGLFAPDFGIYPNVGNPYLIYLEDLDGMASSLTDIDSQLPVLINLVNASSLQLAAIHTVLTSILNVLMPQIPLAYDYNGNVKTTTTVGLGALLFDALYLPSTSNIQTSTQILAEYMTLARMSGIPWLDPSVGPSASSCYVSVGQSAPGFPNGNFYGQPTDNAKSDSYYTTNYLSPVSGLPIESFSRCYSANYNVSKLDQRIVQLATVSGLNSRLSQTVT